MSRLVIFDTHPIQYRSPVFRALVDRHASLGVYFFDSAFHGSQFWFHEVGTAKSSDFGLKLTAGFPSHTLGLAGKTWWGKARVLAKVLREEKPTAILIYGYYLPEHWILNWLCRRMGIALFFVGETYTKSRSGWRQWVKALPLKWFYRGVRTFIAIGDKTEKFYQASGVDSVRIKRARYCVDNRFFAIDSVEHEHLRETWRQQFGIPQDSVVMLFAGRLFHRKRPWDVVELHKRLPLGAGVTTVMVGAGPMESQLRGVAMGIPRLMPIGFQSQAAMRAAYCGADIFFLPSEYETWGLVVNEAMACGLPSVITDTCGAANDLVVDGDNGFVFGVGDIDTAAKRVEMLARDHQLRKRFSEHAYQRVLTHYTPENFADVILTSLAERGEAPALPSRGSAVSSLA